MIQYMETSIQRTSDQNNPRKIRRLPKLYRWSNIPTVGAYTNRQCEDLISSTWAREMLKHNESGFTSTEFHNVQSPMETSKLCDSIIQWYATSKMAVVADKIPSSRIKQIKGRLRRKWVEDYAMSYLKTNLGTGLPVTPEGVTSSVMHISTSGGVVPIR